MSTQANSADGLAELLPMWEDPQVVGAFVAWHPSAVKFYRPASMALLAEAGVGPGSRVLDVGTGTGIPSLLAAEIVGPTGEVVATDPSTRLLAAAQAHAQAAGVTNLSFQRAAIEALPFADHRFDAVVSQLGLMFAADLPRALREVKRVLRPGGRAAFLAWGPYGENPFWAIFRDILARYTNADAEPAGPDAAEDSAEAPDPRGPFRFAAPGMLASALRDAGFAEVREETRRLGLHLPDPEPIYRFWADGNESLEALPAERQRAVRNEVLAAYRSYSTSDGEGIELPAAVVIASGMAPER